MGSSVLPIISTFFDLLALTTCLGSLGCCLLLVPSSLTAAGPMAVTEAIFARLWRLIAACIAGLTVSGISELAMRTAEMSGRPVAEISPLLLTALSKTHYGHVWLVRLAALTALWVGWQIGKGRSPRSYAVPAFMLGCAAVIAITRSASGHAADLGDMTFPELMDWLHLMAVSAWGGGLLALSAVVLPTAVTSSDQGSVLIADLARRFSTLAGIALGTLMVTAMYNGWLQVGSFHALWNNTYGLIIVTKLLLLVVLVAIGASNRYGSVPLLQKSVGRPVTGRGFLHHWLVVRRLTAGRDGLDGTKIARRFMHKVRAEAIIITAVLLCTACLLHSMPARHFSHDQHEDAVEKPMAEPMHHMHHSIDAP